MRRSVGLGVGVLVGGLGCLATEPPPHAPEPVRPVLPLAPLVGRWEALTPGESGPVVRVPCAGENPWVEIRDDGGGDWGLLASVGGGELRMGQVTTAEISPAGVRFGLDGDTPLVLAWVEADRVATFAGWFGELPFVAPAHRASVPVVPEADCPSAPIEEKP